MTTIKKGMLWFGWDWEKAINQHIKTNDCYILEVYKDESNNLIDHKWVFDCFKLMGYGNRFKKYKTKIPNKYLIQVVNLRKENLNKFQIVDKYDNKILLENN